MSNRTNNTLIIASITLGVILLVAAILYVWWSLPPRTFKILVGREGGAYYNAALAYQEIAAERGFTLEIVPTAGSVQTLDMLEAGEAGIGFAQGGTAQDRNPAVLNTMAGVFYEPLWIFYRAELDEEVGSTIDTGVPLEITSQITPTTLMNDLGQLEGMRINIGEAGSGTQMLATQLLDETGVNDANSDFQSLSNSAAAAALAADELDAAFIVSAPSAQIIQDLLQNEDLQLMSLALAEGYAKRHDFLTVLGLPAGTMDPAAIQPAQDTALLATVANLIVRTDFHPDLLRLMTLAIVATHSEGGILEGFREFPNFDHADLPVSPREMAYIETLKSGDSWLDNYLPFWAAALIDRYLVFVLPIALLLFPLVSRAPVVLNMFSKMRINRWYKQVRELEMHADKFSVQQLDEARVKLEALDDYLAEQMDVGSTYMPDLYNLRQHIGYVQEKLTRRRAHLTGEVIVAPLAPEQSAPIDTPPATHTATHTVPVDPNPEGQPG